MPHPTPYKQPITTCAHGNTGSCPHDYLTQIRLRNPSWDTTPNTDPWQTVMISACDHPPTTWHSQVANLKRRQGYQVRTIRIREEA